MNHPKRMSIGDSIMAAALTPIILNEMQHAPASSIEQECSELARAIAPAVLRDLTEDNPHGKALTDAVNRACDQLEGQGPLSERIALQLLEALARYELALGQLLIAEDATTALPRYKLQWCRWEHGFSEDQQTWREQQDPERVDCTDEDAMRTHARRLDIAYAPTFRHRAVLEVKP